MSNNPTFFLLLLCVLTFSGCGQMGPLYLPSETPVTPASAPAQETPREAAPDEPAEQPDPRHRPDT
ncbi:MAG: lipoprotein [Gammaproteobacteria bacterium]|nr:lipoprotein [Gammaproteobacteria bacterium]